MRIEELLKIERDLPKALERFSDDQAVRFMTMHKSKALEFDSVMLLGVENRVFWGKARRRALLVLCWRITRKASSNNDRY